MNRRHDFAKLEREYITSQMSLRELCRRHGITAHSLVVVQAKQGRWAEKRGQYRAKESDAYIQHHAVNMAAREAEVRFHAIEAIDEAIDKFRVDMKRTEKKLIGGEWVEVPVMLITPKDVAMLIDRFQVLFARPSSISQHQGLTITSEPLPVEALQAFIERTRGLTDSQAGWSDSRVVHVQLLVQRVQVPRPTPMRRQPPTTWSSRRSGL